jgi:hypothetical protein
MLENLTNNKQHSSNRTMNNNNKNNNNTTTTTTMIITTPTFSCLRKWSPRALLTASPPILEMVQQKPKRADNKIARWECSSAAVNFGGNFRLTLTGSRPQ